MCDCEMLFVSGPPLFDGRFAAVEVVYKVPCWCSMTCSSKTRIRSHHAHRAKAKVSLVILTPCPSPSHRRNTGARQSGRYNKSLGLMARCSTKYSLPENHISRM